jgi:hypothetical protein
LADIEHILDAIEQHGRDADGVVFENTKNDSMSVSQQQSLQMNHLIGTVDDMIETYANEERG